MPLGLSFDDNSDGNSFYFFSMNFTLSTVEAYEILQKMAFNTKKNFQINYQLSTLKYSIYISATIFQKFLNFPKSIEGTNVPSLFFLFTSNSIKKDTTNILINISVLKTKMY